MPKSVLHLYINSRPYAQIPLWINMGHEYDSSRLMVIYYHRAGMVGYVVGGIGKDGLNGGSLPGIQETCVLEWRYRYPMPLPFTQTLTDLS